MSHPENTLKQIIERQDKKIESLIDIITTIVYSYQTKPNITRKYINNILKDLEEVRNNGP